MRNEEIWASPTGERCYLRAVRFEIPDDEDYEPWYPEGPGQRPPQCYRMVGIISGATYDEFTVFPVDPWSPCDAASDLLIREGWTPPPPTPEELATCEHGLSASLCAGPMHYPDDRRDW